MKKTIEGARGDARRIAVKPMVRTKVGIMRSIVEMMSAASTSGGWTKKYIAEVLSRKFPGHTPIQIGRDVQWLVSASRNDEPWAKNLRLYLQGLELHEVKTRPLRFFIAERSGHGQTGAPHGNDKTDARARHVSIDSTAFTRSGGKCVVCKSGETKPGKATESFTRGETTMIVKGLPADICGQCGESYFSSDVVRIIEKLMEDAVRKGVEVEVLRYAA